ncbi:hypothetical protein [Macrococcoides canis]|uniref:hypothetical protein n=1 Tax=Macrococcoides canis TaxID=1855823 RepID=UPI0020B6A999|nr:hypothetical protein [Macrococcus canis]UTH06292.1 hypothetical protein KFV07_08905 [Macrococcus canis]
MDDTLHYIHTLLIQMKKKTHLNYFNVPHDYDLIMILVEMNMIELHIDYFIDIALEPCMRIQVTCKGELFIHALLDDAV